MSEYSKVIKEIENLETFLRSINVKESGIELMITRAIKIKVALIADMEMAEMGKYYESKK